MLVVTFHNDGTGTLETGNYDVKVIVNGVVVDQCRIEGHRRADGWRELVARLGRQKADDNER